MPDIFDTQGWVMLGVAGAVLGLLILLNVRAARERRDRGPDVGHLVKYGDMADDGRLTQRIEELRPILAWMREHPDEGGPTRYFELAPPRFVDDLIAEVDRLRAKEAS